MAATGEAQVLLIITICWRIMSLEYHVLVRDRVHRLMNVWTYATMLCTIGQVTAAMVVKE